MKSLKKLFFGIISIIVFIIIYKGYVFYQATQVFEYSNQPGISTYKIASEIPLRNFNLKIDSIEKFSLPNLYFKIPLIKKVIYDSLIVEKAKIITFKDSTSIATVYDSDIKGLDFINNIGNIDKRIKESTFKDYLNKRGISSNYELLKYIFSFTPDDIRFFDSNKDILVGYTLLRLKEMVMATGYEDYLNNFETENIKGFQFGKPEYSKAVILNFFDNKNNQYSIIFNGKIFTQEIIDYILNNVKTNANRVDGSPHI